MTEEIKNVTCKILSHDIENPKLFGTLIADIIFKKQDSAIVMDNNGHCFLVHSSARRFSELYQIITKLLSVLSYLETNGLIYRQGDDDKDKLTVFYEGCNDLKQSTGGCTYSLGNGYKLKKEDSKYLIASSDNEQLLVECHNLSALNKELCYYLKSFVYPAAGLSDYVSHNYLSDSDYRNNVSLSLSRYSIWIAIGIACLSPIVSLLLGNQWGVTEIKENQYKQFMQRTAITDTIVIEQYDTIVKFVYDTVYIKKK